MNKILAVGGERKGLPLPGKLSTPSIVKSLRLSVHYYLLFIKFVPGGPTEDWLSTRGSLEMGVEREEKVYVNGNYT